MRKRTIFNKSIHSLKARSGMKCDLVLNNWLPLAILIITVMMGLCYLHIMYYDHKVV